MASSHVTLRVGVRVAWWLWYVAALLGAVRWLFGKRPSIERAASALAARAICLEEIA